MPFDGFGVFIRLRNWVADATAGVKIRADFHDTEDDGFAQGLSQCIVKDGQSTITQNIPFNSKRITALADPVNAQDAATKAYADTKAPIAGGTFTGDVIIKETTPSLTLDGVPGSKNSIYGQKNDKNRWEIVLGDATAETGSNAGSDFDLISYADDGTTVIGTALFGTRSTAMLTVKANPTAALGIATKQYVDAADATRLPITGGTVTGNLAVNGELLAAAGYIRFGTTGGPGYLQWQGDGNYVLSGGGTIWHSGNFNPNASTLVSNARLVFAADVDVTYPVGGNRQEPIGGGVVTGWFAVNYSGLYPYVISQMRMRQLQFYTTSWWTIPYV